VAGTGTVTASMTSKAGSQAAVCLVPSSAHPRPGHPGRSGRLDRIGEWFALSASEGLLHLDASLASEAEPLIRVPPPGYLARLPDAHAIGSLDLPDVEESRPRILGGAMHPVLGTALETWGTERPQTL
jgi:hypothetical protein